MAAMAAAAAAAAERGKTAAKPTSKSDDAWILLQKKTFTNWVNVQLKEVGAKVDQVEVDFRTGVYVIQMLEVCSKKKFGKYNKAPKMKAQELENLTSAFKFLQDEGLKLVNIGPGDVNDGNLKLILGLLWTIIYHYQVSAGFEGAGGVQAKKGAKDLLLEWVRSKIPDYNIGNFTSDWTDGRAICALTNVIGGEPWLIPNHKQLLSEAKLRNAQLGIESATENLGVPKLIAPEDFVNPDIDEHSVMTYVSYFKTAQRVGKAPAAAPAAAAAPAPAPAPVAAAPAPAPAAAPASPAPAKGKLPPPWERKADWREYKGDDLGGRCKIRVYYSTTTGNQVIRKNAQALQMLLERENVHKRPDFEPWIPIDVDMSTDLRDKIFKKAGTKTTPLLFIDDEFVGAYDRIMEMNESGELHALLEY